jgi:hypothetical protein
VPGERVVELPGDDDGTPWIGASARRFAARYDHRAAFHAYLRLPELPVVAAEQDTRLNSGRLADQSADP